MNGCPYFNQHLADFNSGSGVLVQELRRMREKMAASPVMLYRYRTKNCTGAGRLSSRGPTNELSVTYL